MAEQLTLAQLVEVFRIERRQRWEQGDRVLAEAFLQRHPALQDDENGVLELVYHEVLLREELGETPHLEEYRQRFPQLAARLEPLFEVHRAIESGSLFDTPHCKMRRPTPTWDSTSNDAIPPTAPESGNEDLVP